VRTVEHGGKRYLLLKRSDDSSLVRDPGTGEERYLPNDELEPGGESPLSVAAERVPEPRRRLLFAVHSAEALGLLLELDERGPTPARELVGWSERCESDLSGLLAELRAAGLLETATVGGERGYATTEPASEALAALR